MKVIRTISHLRTSLGAARRRGRTIGFVPTMGYFHEGHLSLMRRSVAENHMTVVSLFVNPLQFGPKEDLETYPRDFKRDRRLAELSGVDILFVPPLVQMYPLPLETRVTVAGVDDVLCGRFRGGHFTGVATVVAKLLNIVMPDTLYLGQKDFQQVHVIRTMIRDLDYCVRLRVGKTVREPDGLAKSSRNVYLTPSERAAAPSIFRALCSGARLIRSGESDAVKIISLIKKLLNVGMGDSISFSVDYVECVGAFDLRPVRTIRTDVVLAAAVRLSRARLIDNLPVKWPGPGGGHQ